MAEKVKDAPEYTALQILNAYQNAKMSEKTEREIAMRCFEYSANRVDGQLGQWKTDVRNALGDKPAVSWNNIRKFVNRICGAQRQTKMDEKCFPRDDESDPTIADILTDLLKYVKDVNVAEREIAQAFRNALHWRGWIKTEWNDDLDPLGEITIRSVNPFRVYIVGDGDNYDVSMDRRGLIEELPMDKDEIIARWKDKEEEIEGLNSLKETDGVQVSDSYDYGFGKVVPTNHFYDENSKKFIVLRYQKREYKDFKFLQDAMGKLTEAPEDDAQLKAILDISKQMGLDAKLIKKKRKYVKICYSVGNVMLEEKESTYNHGQFDLTGLFCYNDNGQITGVVQDLLDPQDEKNKRHSQAIHILGTSAKNGYFVKKNYFVDIEQAKKEFSKLAPMIEVNGNPTEGIKSIENNFTAIPALLKMEEISGNEMKEISGIGDASLGVVPEGVKSGRGIQALQLPTETMVAEIFDNLVQTRKIVFKKVLSMIQQYYDSERRIRVLGDYTTRFMPPEVAKMKQMIETQIRISNPLYTDDEVYAMADKMLEIQDGSKVITINKMIGDKKLNDISVGKYDLVIDQVSNNPTTRRGEYFDKLNMKALGAPIKWSTILKSYDGKGREDMIADALEAETAMQMMTQLPPQLAPQDKTQTPNQANPQDLMLNSAGVQQP